MTSQECFKTQNTRVISWKTVNIKTTTFTSEVHLSSLISSKKECINMATLSKTYTIDILSLLELITLELYLVLIKAETESLLNPWNIVIRDTETIDNFAISCNIELFHHRELTLKLSHYFTNGHLLTKKSSIVV